MEKKPVRIHQGVSHQEGALNVISRLILYRLNGMGTQKFSPSILEQDL